MNASQKLALLSVGASCVTLGLKFGAWFLTDSVSLYSDAMESFVNLAAAIVALVVVTIVARPADESHPWGHDKAEYFSSGVEGALILVAALTIMFEAWQKLRMPTPPLQLGAGLGLSALASVVNAGTALILLKQAKRLDSIVLEADARHLLTDVWTSVGVIAGLTVLLFAPPSWAILDPIIALLVGLNIIRTGVDLLRRSADGLMDATLPTDEVATIHRTIEHELGPAGRHAELKTRKSGSKRFVEFKLYVPGQITVDAAHHLCDQLEAAIEQALGNTTVMVHVEPEERAPKEAKD
ncbi:cation diffusion facilitator family transporter [Parachitinimonas caeni]|uniref:Cation diffusion facilitator family transporter n=1 Tax=Parachitinimonas caeni TaxID=3031301 RepID=A0ABT7DWX9_9NEIS|nr:cation diffusion facilitator family transporter [Parachitinimonas caeni]MDK2124329.1 cation diffusion facilitator family transporter [Parachitinimonas caeni]